MAGRKCTICAHPAVNEINEMLVNNVPLNEIVTVYNDLSKMALSRHKQNHIPKTLSKAQEAKEIAQGDAVMTELKRCFERVNRLFDACDHWLKDPEDPSKYNLDPRDRDITVIYTEPGERKTKKALLSQLLAKVETKGYKVHSWEYRIADPRRLILQTANQLQGQIELLAKLTEQLPPEHEKIVSTIVLILKQEIHDSKTLERISTRLLTDFNELEG